MTEMHDGLILSDLRGAAVTKQTNQDVQEIPDDSTGRFNYRGPGSEPSTPAWVLFYETPEVVWEQVLR